MLVSLTFNTGLFDLEDGLRNTLEQYFQGYITASEAQLALGVSADEFFGLLGTTFQIAQRGQEPNILVPTTNIFPGAVVPSWSSEGGNLYPVNFGTYALRFLAVNWPRIAGFAYREYQDFGRGCVLLDCFCCWGTYLSQNELSSSLQALPSTMKAGLRDRAMAYNPEEEFVYAIGSLDRSLNRSNAAIFSRFMDLQPTEEIVFGSFLPAISPVSCSDQWLAPDHLDRDDRFSGLKRLRCISPHDSFFHISQ